MTFDKLLEAGYKQFSVPRYSTNADRLCQKTVWREDKKLYFLNVREWVSDHSTQLSAEVHFYTGEEDEGAWFTVELHGCEDRTTVEEIEEFFADVYEKMNCVPDIHNN